MVYCVGLTGTIASGKSTAAAYFKSVGISIISADALAKALTLNGQPAFDEIKHHFGASILTDQGELNRRALRHLIISDASERLWLEKCVHPRIREAITSAIEHVTSPYCVIEIPLLTQRDDYPYLHRVLVIESTEQKQIKRLMARDTCSKEEAMSLLATQPHQETHRTLADDLVSNTGTQEELAIKLARLHQKYLAKSLCT